MKLPFELNSQMSIVNSLLKEMRDSMNRRLKINNHLIFGDRGVGKTTLVRLLYEFVENDPKLKEAYHFIFASSSFHGVGGFREIERLIANVSIKDISKHQILVIDDLDLMLSDSEGNAHSLREMLIRDEPRIALVATANNSFMDKLGASKALYGFFSQHTLEGVSDKDLLIVLGEMLKNQKWYRLNEELTLTNTFWLATIADHNPRLLTIIKNIFHSLNNQLSTSIKNIDPEEFLINFFELSGPSFKNDLTELPRYSRYFLEEASFCGQFFKIRDVALDIANPSREAIRLIHLGYLKKNLDGEYSFTSKPLKAWLRFMKQIPLTKVLNVDQPVIRDSRYI